MKSQSQEHNHLRRQAVLIASQLPDNTAEALLVLGRLVGRLR
jgi:hypothetical protein